MSRKLLLCLMSVVICGAVNAGSLYVSANGVFSNSDAADALVAPGEPFSLKFTVQADTSPLSGTVDALGFDAPVINFSYDLNGQPVAGAPGEIRFNTLANGGLFDITFGSGLNAAEFSFEGEQAFSGSTTSPVFTTGNYSVSNWTYSDPSNYDTENPTALSVSITPTPEAPTLLLLCGGSLALLGLSMRKGHRVC